MSVILGYDLYGNPISAMASTRKKPLRVGDTIWVKKSGQFVIKDGEVFYDQPDDEPFTIENEKQLDSIKQRAERR